MGECLSCLDKEDEKEIKKNPKDDGLRESIKSSILSAQQQKSKTAKVHNNQQEKKEDINKSKDVQQNKKKDIFDYQTNDNNNENILREGNTPGAGNNITIIVRNSEIKSDKPITFSAPPANKKNETNNEDEENKNVKNP